MIFRGGHNPAENPDTISQLLLALVSTSTATCHMVLIITRLIVCFRTPFTETVDWTNFKTPPPYEEWENKNWETKYANFKLHNYDLVDSLTVISYIFNKMALVQWLRWISSSDIYRIEAVTSMISGSGLASLTRDPWLSGEIVDLFNMEKLFYWCVHCKEFAICIWRTWDPEENKRPPSSLFL